jgi:hypothetical protein
MTWLIKISQQAIDQLKQEYYQLYSQVRQQQQTLRRQMEQKFAPASSYVEQMEQDHQIAIAEQQLNDKLIYWIQSNLQNIMNSGDIRTHDAFMQELSRLQKMPEFDRQEYENYYDDDVLEWYLDNSNWASLEQLLEKHQIDWEEHEFPTGKKVITIEPTKEPSEWYVVEVEENGKIGWTQDAYKWVRDSVDQSFEYIPEKSGDQFWEEIGEGAVAYHRTDEENLASIQEHGLLPEDKTRGLSNRGTGPAVFASWSPELDMYGALTLEINLYQMKLDGYMPGVQQEEPVAEGEVEQSLAHGIGITDYYAEIEQGIDEETIVIYDTIPPKYLRVVQGINNA